MGGTSTRGFTLMELMMAIAVIGVLAAVAIPSFNEFRLNSRMASAANDLLAALNVARSEAIKRQQPVAFCGSAMPNANPPACNNQLTGWVVWVDDNNDGVVDVSDNNGVIDAGEQVVVAHELLPAALNVTTNFNVISYAATGFVQNFGPAARGIVLCDERQNAFYDDQLRRRIVSLSPTGRPAVVRTASAVAELPAPEPPVNANWQC